jgi:pimeloyl-ACP methyl ester carboxylesterase
MMDKRPWVLLRGLTRESGHWGDFPQRLAEADNGAPVICMDLPGNGRLFGDISPASVEAMADHCHSQWSAGNSAHSARVLAMSLGAMVAVAWAQRYPSDVSELVLVSTSLRPFSPIHHRLRPANYMRLVWLMSTSPPCETIEATILKLTSGRSWTDMQRTEVLQRWCLLRRQHPVARANALRQLLAAARFQAPLVSPLQDRNAILLLAGNGDRLVDPRCSDALSRAWGVLLHKHPMAGHDLPLDDSDWVIRKVLDRRARTQESIGSIAVWPEATSPPAPTLYPSS